MKVCYDESLRIEGGQGGLRILYPTATGSIEYTFLHSVQPERNCDVWRMGVVNALDEKGAFLHRLTKDGAEWEMAVRLADRPDFIGGFIHGDEIGTEPLIILDGQPAALCDLTGWREFSCMKIRAESRGFDPAEPARAVLTHRKQLVYDAEGVHLEQEVSWLENVTLDSKFKSFLAMMPPVKHDPENPANRITDSFAMGADAVRGIAALPVAGKNVQNFTVEGRESGYRFMMSVEDYAPRYPNSYLASLSDNSNQNYHKMYIAFAGGEADEICAGTKWHAVTHYQITKAFF